MKKLRDDVLASLVDSARRQDQIAFTFPVATNDDLMPTHHVIVVPARMATGEVAAFLKTHVLEVRVPDFDDEA